ncbi:uncharacterized protein Bfra_004885 [Botrytis fragariae]|uniref:Uncharacterized protein n=1 Tax=Botrytis fragariae TaxID=1964551 RepID=A0A8H6AU38_9HELO|nr:uncharacterized protein Bfra_004885 [Botrytis fragariae]KAF5873425.1 hypothetical protein Bfra_004885 [Botrytis fragariae]
MEERGSSGELRLKDEERGNGLEVEMEMRKENMPGMDWKPNTDDETTICPRRETGSDQNVEIPLTPFSSLMKTRSSLEIYTLCRNGSSNGREKRMMTYEYQRAISTQRKPMIAERKRVSVVIEEGCEHYGNGCGVFNSSLRCGREKGKKCWEDLWGKFRRL